MKTETQEIVFDFCARLKFEEGADGERELVGIDNIELRLFDKRPDGSIITEHLIPIDSFRIMCDETYLTTRLGTWLYDNYGNTIAAIADVERDIEVKELVKELNEEYYG